MPAHLVTVHSELSCDLSAVTSVRIIEGPLYYMILIFISGFTSSKHSNKQMIRFIQTVAIMENSMPKDIASLVKIRLLKYSKRHFLIMNYHKSTIITVLSGLNI